jgi:hypothetical protein
VNGGGGGEDDEEGKEGREDAGRVKLVRVGRVGGGMETRACKETVRGDIRTTSCIATATVADSRTAPTGRPGKTPENKGNSQMYDGDVGEQYALRPQL